MIRKGLKLRIVSAILAISTMLSLVSCDMFRFKSKINAEPLSEQDLVRLMVNAINDKKASADSYAAIPEIQRDGLSYSYFIQFVDIMTGISQSNSDNRSVSSFRLMTEEDVEDATDGFEDSYYGNIVGAELLYGEEQQSCGVYLLFSEEEDGMPYLSEEWISDVIDLYNYGEHYFDMIDSENTDGLFTLLRPGLPDAYTDEAVRTVANEVISYYEISVRGDLSDRMRSMVTLLLPNHIHITIPETLNISSNRLVRHDVDIITENGAYDIIDEIPVNPDMALSQVSRNDEVLFTCGSTYSASAMTDLLGESGRTTYYPSSGAFSVYYDGLILVFDLIDYQNDNDWIGVLSQVKIQGDSPYVIGSGLYSGMPASEILELYPYFYDEYLVEVDNEHAHCNVSIALSPDDTVAYVRITAN